MDCGQIFDKGICVTTYGSGTSYREILEYICDTDCPVGYS